MRISDGLNTVSLTSEYERTRKRKRKRKGRARDRTNDRGREKRVMRGNEKIKPITK